jgi:polar amino acid transport system substrate-binding protein
MEVSAGTVVYRTGWARRPACRSAILGWARRIGGLMIPTMLILGMFLGAPVMQASGQSPPVIAPSSAPKSPVPAPASELEGEDQDRPGGARGRLYRTIIRFVTDNDYPPFNYLDDEGTLTGFNVDIARAICLELDVSCDVQPRDWKDLVPALKRGDTDAVIASLAITPRALGEVDFTDRYYFSPGRFAVRKDRHQKIEISPVGLEAKRIGVLKGSAHEAYLRAFFRDCVLQTFDQAELAHDALQAGTIDFIFGDGTHLAFWLSGTNSKGCCELRGGPFFDPVYFGDGLAVAVRKGDFDLKRIVNVAIRKLRENGQLKDILKRHFPAAYVADLERQ